MMHHMMNCKSFFFFFALFLWGVSSYVQVCLVIVAVELAEISFLHLDLPPKHMSQLKKCFAVDLRNHS